MGWCDVHHVRHWIKHFGPTALWNLVLLCDKHHNMLHRRGWSARLDVNGNFEVTTPWGESWTTQAPTRVRKRVRLPGAPGDAGEASEVLDHLEFFEKVIGHPNRVTAFVAQARTRRGAA